MRSRVKAASTDQRESVEGRPLVKEKIVNEGERIETEGPRCVRSEWMDVEREASPNQSMIEEEVVHRDGGFLRSDRDPQTRWRH